jgi:hypothetical protein
MLFSIFAYQHYMHYKDEFIMALRINSDIYFSPLRSYFFYGWSFGMVENLICLP